MSSPSADGVDARAAAIAVLFTGVAALLVVVAVLLANGLPADPGTISAEAVRQFLYPPEDVRPEPTERRVFLVSLLLLPVLALAGAWGLSRSVVRWKADHAALALAVVAAGILVLFGNESARAVLRSNHGAWWFTIGLLVAGGCLALSTRSANTTIGHNRVTVASIGIVAVVAAWCAFSWRTLDVRAMDAIARYDIHLDAVLYSVLQAVEGRVPLADYVTQYGFFGVVLAPWFRVVGLSVLSLTLTLNLLYWVALAALGAFVFRQFRQLPLAIGACAVLFYFVNSWNALTGDPDPYYQYTPLRLLFPAVSVLLVSEWLRRPGVRGAALISAFAGLGLVWQLDSGVAVAGAWLLLLGYRAFAAVVAQVDWRAPLRTTAIAAGIVPLPVLAFMAWVRFRAGVPVDFSVALESSRLYYGTGFYMLPMPTTLHPWMIVVAILAFGIVIGSLRLVGAMADGRGWILLHLALLGLGLFPYYQGRSHDRVLIYVAWPAILIAFLVADWAWTLGQENRLRRVIAAGMALPVLAVGAMCALFLLADVPRTLRVVQERLRGYVAAPWVQQSVELVRNSTHGQSEAVVLSRFQAVYLAEAGLASSLRGPGLVEVITRAQGDEIVRQIELIRPAQIFLGPYYADDDTNPFRLLRPTLLRDYALTARTDGDALRLYTRRADAPR